VIYPEAQCMIDVGDAQAEVIDTVWRSRTIRGAHMEVRCCYEDLKIFETDSSSKPGNRLWHRGQQSHIKLRASEKLRASGNLTKFYLLFLPSRLNGGLISFRSI
jgi:hypothetical protein